MPGYKFMDKEERAAALADVRRAAGTKDNYSAPSTRSNSVGPLPEAVQERIDLIKVRQE